jgi:hypothetical protein
VHVQRDHAWRMEKLAELCRAGDGLLLATPYKGGHQTIEAKAHGENDPAVLTPRLSHRTAAISTPQSTTNAMAMIFEPVV